MPEAQRVTHAPLTQWPAPPSHVVELVRYCPELEQHSPPQQTAALASLHEEQHARLASHVSPMSWSMAPSPHASAHVLLPSPLVPRTSPHL